MDTSETYIKMCVKAEEIQKLWNPADGDFCWHDDDGAEYLGNVEFPATVAVVHIATGNSKNYWHNWLWLPRQDQLQEMLPYQVGVAKDNFWSALDDIHKWGFEQKFLDFIPLSTEQLWLTFVMKEKFGKIWDGENWNG